MLVGTSDYEEPGGLDHLPGVHNNLVALEQALTHPETGVFAHDRCMVVNNPDSPQSFMRRLVRATQQAEDVLLVYYAGHGILGGPEADLYLTVRQTDERLADMTSVAFSAVRHAIEDSPAKTKILILDCCFSGRAIGAMSSKSAALAKIAVSGTYILTSTEANRESRAVPGERYTAFTAELLSISTNGIPGRASDVLLGDLYQPLQVAMAKRGFPKPKNLAGDTSGNIVVRRVPRQEPVSPPQHQAEPPAPKPEVPPTDLPLHPLQPASENWLEPPTVTSTDSRPALRPLISDDSLRGLGRGAWTTALWILTSGGALLVIGSIGATASGAYHDAGTAITGMVLTVGLFVLFGFLLLRRYLSRRSIAMRTSQEPAGTEASINEVRRVFFEQVFARLHGIAPGIRAPRVRPANECSFASGPYGHYALTFSRLGFRVEIYLDTGDNDTTKAIFDVLHQRRNAVEDELGFEVTWERLDNNRASRIAAYLTDFNVSTADGPGWSNAVEWATNRVSALHRVLHHELRALCEQAKPAQPAPPDRS
ncbi:DUF4268 domain-containing protein [Amycolatopsis sp. OK19-0408]|uniref:DUF4268 domain-containing protein n=1 Tax=Amycolatopsis iheyensis TaxID=2945988 RepID=A0A9X2NLR3_9PSEU|nr:DUF4268 domain-containing protein [Amycolatopsis iheyensis]MCR6488914.1 DUF4268 domain-containing protein [Amycolatopsis iheyensis]